MNIRRRGKKKKPTLQKGSAKPRGDFQSRSRQDSRGMGEGMVRVVLLLRRNSPAKHRGGLATAGLGPETGPGGVVVDKKLLCF